MVWKWKPDWKVISIFLAIIVVLMLVLVGYLIAQRCIVSPGHNSTRLREKKQSQKNAEPLVLKTCNTRDGGSASLADKILEKTLGNHLLRDAARSMNQTADYLSTKTATWPEEDYSDHRGLLNGIFAVNSSLKKGKDYYIHLSFLRHWISDVFTSMAILDDISVSSNLQVRTIISHTKDIILKTAVCDIYRISRKFHSKPLNLTLQSNGLEKWRRFVDAQPQLRNSGRRQLKMFSDLVCPVFVKYCNEVTAYNDLDVISKLLPYVRFKD